VGEMEDKSRRERFDAFLDKWALTPIAHVIGWFI